MKSRKVQLLIDEFRKRCAQAENPEFVENFVFALQQKLEGNDAYWDFIKQLEQIPVPIETFLDHSDFMGATDLTLWPEVRKAVVEINSNWFMGINHGAQTQYIGMGATGTGKSEIAKATAAFNLHVMGCMRKPQTYWGLPSSTQIILPIFGAKPKVSKNVLYTPLRGYLEAMPWFQKNLRHDKYVESEMVFEDKNIRVSPIGADVDSILGEAVFAAMIDEINFMQIVEKSKKADVGGRSATYDQAQDIYRKTTRRKSGRFTKPGPNVGVISTMSSTHHPGEFTEVLHKQARDNDWSHIYIYNKAQYEVAPEGRYSGAKFHVCVHEDAAGTIQLKEIGEKLPKFATIYDVPVELKNEFIEDPEGATRDIIGRSVRPLSPFFTRVSAIESAFDLGRMSDLPNIVDECNVVLDIHGMPRFSSGHYCKNPSRPRYVHIDLAHTGDRCGIGMVRFDGMAEMSRKGGNAERLPTATVELAVTIEPGADAEHGIDIADVRSWVMRLKTELGYPIKIVSFDSWNSLESRQQMKKAGMPTQLVSVDKTTAPMFQFRDALYDGRVALPDNPILKEEMRDLEYDSKANAGKGKIDHPPSGTKDCIDGVVGAYHLMLQRSQTWRSGDDGGRIMSGDDRFGGERESLGDRS